MANSSDECFLPPSSPKLAAHFKAEFNPGRNDSVWQKSPCVSFTEEEEEANKPETMLQVRERRKWRKAALAVTIANLILSLIMSGASFFASASTDSSSVLAAALDVSLAVFTACIVIWRFHDGVNGKIAPTREKQGSVAFGIAFMVDALIAIIVSTKHLIEKTKPVHANVIWPSLLGWCFVYCALALMEFWISKKLKSPVLVALCIDDGLTGGLLFAFAADEFIQDKLPHLWFLDHSVAIGVSIILLFCGIKILVEIFVYKKLPFQIFS